MEWLLGPRISCWSGVVGLIAGKRPSGSSLAARTPWDPSGSRCPHCGEFFLPRAAGVYGKIMEEEGGKVGQWVWEGGASAGHSLSWQERNVGRGRGRTLG